jgi:hypothetical protein
VNDCYSKSYSLTVATVVASARGDSYGTSASCLIGVYIVPADSLRSTVRSDHNEQEASPPLDCVQKPSLGIRLKSAPICYFMCISFSIIIGGAPGEYIGLVPCIIGTDLVRPPAHYSWLLLAVLNVYVHHC